MNTTNNEQMIDFEDDKTVPFETKILGNRTRATALLVIYSSLVLICLCLIIYFGVDNYNLGVVIFFCFGLMLSLFGFYCFYQEYNSLSPKNPQFIINEEGIKTPKQKFMHWSNVTKEQIIEKKLHDFFIVYEYDKRKEEIYLDMDILDMEIPKLTKLLKIYRGRFEANKLKMQK